MLNINRVLKSDRLLRALTGLNCKAFNELLVPFTAALNEAKYSSQKPRKRAPGGGRKAGLLRVEDKLFYILFYFKCYPRFAVAGVLFDFDDSQAHRWVHRLQLILEAALGKKMALPERKLESLEHFLERYPAVKRVMIDATERPIARAQNPEKQRLTYSGKKKRNTRKHLAAVDQNKRVFLLSQAREGKLHDKRFHDEEDIAGSIPDEIPIEVDLGFQGLQNQYVNIQIPHKKPRKAELTQQQKQENQEKSRSRVKCEHAFSGIKRYRVAADIYRNRLSNFDDSLMLTATGLWNFYLMAA